MTKNDGREVQRKLRVRRHAEQTEQVTETCRYFMKAAVLILIRLGHQQNYFKMNTRVGLTTPDYCYTFEQWVTNLTNEIIRSIGANTSLRGGEGTRSLMVSWKSHACMV